MRRRTELLAASLGAMTLLACGGSTLTDEGRSSRGSASTEASRDSSGGSTEASRDSSRGSTEASRGSSASGFDSGVHTDATTHAGFPPGTYSTCMLADEPNTLGGLMGGVTVSSANGVIVMRFGDSAPVTLDFSETSSTSARLSPSHQRWVGPWAWCGGGVTSGGGIADPAPAQGTLDIESATATVNGGTLFVTAAGTVEPADGGGCSTGPLSAAVFCTGFHPSGSGRAGTGSRADAGSPQFSTGVYQCASDLQEFHSAAGGMGTLTLTQTGDIVAATYAGDYAAAGSLELTVTSDGSANPAAGQTFHTMSCAIPSNGALDTEDVTAGSLTLDGDSVFLDLVGAPTGDPACEGSPAYLTLVCARAKGDAG